MKLFYCSYRYIFLLLFVIFSPLQGFSAEVKPPLKISVPQFVPPFAFVQDHAGSREVRGYNVDEITMLAKIMGYNPLFFAQGADSNAIKRLQNNEIDVIIFATARLATNTGLTFIPLNMELHTHIYVHNTINSVTCLKDTEGKKVAMVYNVSYSPDVLVTEPVIYVDSSAEALNLLNEGEIDVFIAPSEEMADYIIDAFSLKNVLKKGVGLGTLPIGMLVNSENTDLIDKLNSSIDYLYKNGHIAQLRMKWFGEPYVENIFEKYGQYLLIISGLALFAFLMIVAWNISLKKRVSKAVSDLQRTEQRAQDIIESSPDMIFLINESGDILHANKQAEETLICSADCINVIQFLAPNSEKDLLEFVKEIFTLGYSKLEFEVKDSSNQKMYVEIAGRMIQGSLNTGKQACLFARNVTERNRIEEELIQSERLAIIGNMAASVAHEVNNPLSIIQANAEDLVLETGLTADMKDGLLSIQRNAKRAGEIIKSLLQTATPRAMNVEILEVGSVIADSLPLLGFKSKGKSIKIHLFCDEPILVQGDRRTLEQILVNLLFNALEHSELDGEIDICVQKDKEDEATVRISIIDFGSGIEKKNLTRIFDPFFSSRKGGFGLGLFITRLLVGRHNGLIYAESDLGKKTVLYLEFPIYSEKE